MQPQLGLVVARSASPAGMSPLAYVRGAVVSPVCIAVAVFTGCLGLGYAGVVGAVVATLAVLALGANAARYRAVRKYIDGQANLQALARRDCQRLKLLRPTGAVRVQHYHELRVLVDEIERLDPAEAARFELQDLLDHWVRLAVTHQRCVDSLRLSGANALPSVPPVCDTTRSKRRRDILQRRIQHRDECVRRMEKLADELEGIDELVRLVAQRTACPNLDADLDREIDRRLWELDEVDAALDQLSA